MFSCRLPFFIPFSIFTRCSSGAPVNLSMHEKFTIFFSLSTHCYVLLTHFLSFSLPSYSKWKNNDGEKMIYQKIIIMECSSFSHPHILHVSSLNATLLKLQISFEIFLARISCSMVYLLFHLMAVSMEFFLISMKN